MKCDKCGHDNNKYSVICEQCGAPLDIEKNPFLQEKYHHKGKHIDIEEIEKVKPKPDFNTTRKTVSKVLVILFIVLFAAFCYVVGTYLIDRESEEMWKTYQNYRDNSSLAVFYFGEEDEINQLCEEYAKTYEFDYLQVLPSKISRHRKQTIKEEMNIYNLTTTVVVVQNQEPVGLLSNVTKENLVPFLQEEEAIPYYFDNPEETLETFREAFGQEQPTLIYLPTSYRETLSKNSETLQSIAEEYSIQYYEVLGYTLSKKQLLHIMTQLGYSEIQDDLIIYVRDGQIQQVIVDERKNAKLYFNLLESSEIIDTSNTKTLIELSLSEWKKLVTDEKQKYVVLVRGDENAAQCDRAESILEQIAMQNQIDIYLLDITEHRQEVSDYVVDLGVDTGITNLPFLMVVEKNHILDYIVGLTTKELYVDKLLELGVIR